LSNFKTCSMMAIEEGNGLLDRKIQTKADIIECCINNIKYEKTRLLTLCLALGNAGSVSYICNNTVVLTMTILIRMES
jgi:hypothetical protein